MLTHQEIDAIGLVVARGTGAGTSFTQHVEDCTQEAHVVYLEAQRKGLTAFLKPEEESGYVAAVTRRRVLKMKPSKSVVADADDQLAEVESRRESAAEEIERLIQEAPDEIWEYLWNRVRLGLSRDETCRVMRTHNERLNQIREDAAEWLLCQYEGVPYEPRPRAVEDRLVPAKQAG